MLKYIKTGVWWLPAEQQGKQWPAHQETVAALYDKSKQ
jgi:hypothetical protein